MVEKGVKGSNDNNSAVTTSIGINNSSAVTQSNNNDNSTDNNFKLTFKEALLISSSSLSPDSSSSQNKLKFNGPKIQTVSPTSTTEKVTTQAPPESTKFKPDPRWGNELKLVPGKLGEFKDWRRGKGKFSSVRDRRLEGDQRSECLNL